MFKMTHAHTPKKKKLGGADDSLCLSNLCFYHKQRHVRTHSHSHSHTHTDTLTLTQTHTLTHAEAFLLPTL